MSESNENRFAVSGSPASAPSPAPDPASKHEDADSPSAELCPMCGQPGAQEWLRAPDRLHGRRHKYTLMRCPGCVLIWQRNPPRPEEMYLHYTNAYHKLISASGENSPHRWQGRRAKIEQHAQSGSILDLGCSSGSFLGSMKRERWKLHGIEMSADCARRAEARTGANVFVGDLLDAPFPPESFDVITCFDVLEHVYEPLRVMAKVCAWLKPGGIFYVQVPNIDSAEGRVFGTYWHGLELPRHLSHFSPVSLRNAAKATGLQEVWLETQRNPAVGTSLRYLWDDIFSAVGIRRTPVVYRGEASLPWRAARKLLRMSVLRSLLTMAPLVGSGEAIHAIFRKETAFL
jgi:SAM-dependent methyltransferase